MEHRWSTDVRRAASPWQQVNKEGRMVYLIDSHSIREQVNRECSRVYPIDSHIKG
jgi:hypothetical protein